MAEYIDKKAAVAAVMATKWQDGADGAMAMEIIDAAPAADVEPVVHAHWVVDDEYLTCSHCWDSYLAGDTRYEVRELLARGETYKRCPHCGAKMDEEVDNNAAV